MVRKKIAVLLTFLLTITAQPAFADVNSYGIKANNKEFTYDKIKLQDSFIANKRGDDSKLYNEFLANVQSGAFIYFQDESGKKVDYKLIVNAFIQAKREGKNFDVDDFVENAPGIGEGEPSKPIDDHHKHDHEGTGDLFKVRSHSEMVSILKDMSDGIYKDIVLSDYDGYFSRKGFSEEDCEDNPNTVIHYKEVLKKAFELDSKYYNNPKYKDLCDLDNFMKLPGLSINFDKAYNANRYDGPLCKAIDCGDAKGDWSIPKDLGDCIKRPHCVGSTYYFESNLGVDKRFFKIMWRPDIEQQVIVTVNKLRQSKGMKPLQIKNDLWAIARYSAKRSQFGYNHVGQLTDQLYTNEDGTQRYWIPGYVPSTDGFEGGNGHGGSAFRQGSKEMNTSLASELFEYNGNIESLSWTSNFYTTGIQFINKLYDSQYPDRLNNMIPEKHITMKDIKNSLPKNILNPNMKFIGVGSTHEAPVTPSSHNGSLGVFIVVGE